MTVINFDVLANSTSGLSPNIMERRLNITDRFSVKDMAICVSKAGTTVVATQAEISVSTPSTYPNLNVFAGAGEAAALQMVYNGFASITIDSTVYYQAYDLRRFYRVPTSQIGTAVSSIAVQGVLNNDGWDNLNYCFSPVSTDFEFSGSGNNQLSVTVPQSGAITTAGTNSQNFLWWIFRGFLIQNINNPIR